MNSKKRTIAVLGGGSIGRSWAALFASKGGRVTIFEPNVEVSKTLKTRILKILLDMPEAIGIEKAKDNIIVLNSLKKTVKGVYAVQEAAPEQLEVKQSIFREVEKFAPTDALLLSSSSGISPNRSSKSMRNPERLVIGHPFSAPHIMPLVEILPQKETDNDYLKHIMDFYVFFGRVPVRLHKKVEGFVANRLQRAVVLEAVQLLDQGVVDVKEMDQIMTNSLGIQWASMGPMLTGVIDGGHNGIKHILRQALSLSGSSTGKGPVDPHTVKVLQEKIARAYPMKNGKCLVHQQDTLQRAIIQLQKTQALENKLTI